MKTIVIIVITLFYTSTVFSQIKQNSYSQYDIAFTWINSPESQSPNENEEDYVHFPLGVSFKLGYGTYPAKWISIGVHTGFEYYVFEDISIIPIFANLRLIPNISIGENTKIYTQIGYGKYLEFGKEILMGNYQRISLGLESENCCSLFIEINNYDHLTKSSEDIWGLGIGASFSILESKTIGTTKQTSSP